MTVDASQNVGIGVTLSNWSTAYANIFQTKGGSLFGDPTSSEGNFGVNTYYNAGYKYAANGYASVYQQYNSQHIWKIAASGTAGNAITFTSAMTLDASGNLGIGTSSPAEKLHISNGASTCQIRIAGQSRNMYLGQDATGAIVYSDGAVPMVFYTNATEKARITSGGTFLVGSTTVVGSGTEIAGFKGTRGISSQSTGGAGFNAGFFWNDATTGDNTFLVFATEAGGTTRGSITYNRTGGLTAYNTTSDYRAKDISGPVVGSGALIDSTPVYMGKMKGATQERPMFIAHEVPAYAHTGEKDAVDADGNPVYQQMDASALIPVMWAEIQSLRQRLSAANL